MMKITSPSSSKNTFLVLMVFLLSFSLTTAATSTARISRSRILLEASSSSIQKQDHRHNYQTDIFHGDKKGLLQNSWNTMSTSSMQSRPPPPAAMMMIMCYKLQGIRHCRPPFPPPPPPPPPSDYEIDPRYGVEKRLVPSGPNPLHN